MFEQKQLRVVNFIVNFALLEKERQIIFYENHFQQFYLSLSGGVRKKIGYIFRIVKTVEKIPIKFLKHLKDGLYEIRVEYDSNIYRIFCCFDAGNLVVLFNGYQKKTQKTDRKEIEKAFKFKQKYFEQKNKDHDKKR